MKSYKSKIKKRIYKSKQKKKNSKKNRVKKGGSTKSVEEAAEAKAKAEEATLIEAKKVVDEAWRNLAIALEDYTKKKNEELIRVAEGTDDEVVLEQKTWSACPWSNKPISEYNIQHIKLINVEYIKIYLQKFTTSNANPLPKNDDIIEFTKDNTPIKLCLPISDEVLTIFKNLTVAITENWKGFLCDYFHINIDLNQLNEKLLGLKLENKKVDDIKQNLFDSLNNIMGGYPTERTDMKGHYQNKNFLFSGHSKIQLDQQGKKQLIWEETPIDFYMSKDIKSGINGIVECVGSEKLFTGEINNIIFKKVHDWNLMNVLTGVTPLEEYLNPTPIAAITCDIIKNKIHSHINSSTLKYYKDSTGEVLSPDPKIIMKKKQQPDGKSKTNNKVDYTICLNPTLSDRAARECVDKQRIVYQEPPKKETEDECINAFDGCNIFKDISLFVEGDIKMANEDYKIKVAYFNQDSKEIVWPAAGEEHPDEWVTVPENPVGEEGNVPEGTAIDGEDEDHNF